MRGLLSSLIVHVIALAMLAWLAPRPVTAVEDKAISIEVIDTLPTRASSRANGAAGGANGAAQPAPKPRVLRKAVSTENAWDQVIETRETTGEGRSDNGISDRDGIGNGIGNGNGNGNGNGDGIGNGLRESLRAIDTPVPHVSKARPAKLVHPSRDREVDPEKLFVALVTVDEDGDVVGARMLQNAPGRRAELAASAIWSFRYDPALDDDGRPVRSTFEQPFQVW